MKMTMWVFVVVLVLLSGSSARADGDANAEPSKARAYHPGTKEFDDLVKSIRKGDFTQQKSKKQRKSTNSDL